MKENEKILVIFDIRIYYGSQDFAIFDDFYSSDCKTYFFNGLVVGFGPKEMPGRMCDIVR